MIEAHPGNAVKRLLRVPTAERLTRGVMTSECRSALDIGAGRSSHLSAYRPTLRTVAIDSSAAALAEARAAGAHDEYLEMDVLEADDREILAANGGRPFDVVALYHVIEHLPKRVGFELLERCERLTSKFVIVETPTGFLEQGPEYGNEAQRHLSGWFPHDFEGLGYEVRGTAGTRYLRGYAGGPRLLRFRGWQSADFLLARLLWIERRPRHAWSIFAHKDVRGVPARLG
jgi:hypothetical protein